MNLASALPFTIRKYPKQRISLNWDDRSEVLQSDVNLYCWRRPVDTQIKTYLEEEVLNQGLKIQRAISTDTVHSELADVRLGLPKSDSLAAEAFIEDVASLASDFLEYSEHGRGRLYLRVVEDDACTKFHTDGYTLRLFTTYLGKGTEWLPESAVNRKALGSSNDQIVRDHTRIERMQPFEVGILKGQLPGQTSIKGIVHRSPGVSSLERRRIILRVDI